MMRKIKIRKVISFIVVLFILWIGCEKLMDRVQVENVKSGSVHFDDYGYYKKDECGRYGNH